MQNPTLSARLRAGTAAAHRRVEHAANLPERIQTAADYADCLRGFLRIRAPLERLLAEFSEWPEWGVDLPRHLRAPALRADLAALGSATPMLAEPPPLPDFAGALGALYVLEGSAQGAGIIWRALQARLGPALGGAASYFGGASPMPWPAFKTVLDGFGARQPQAQTRVLAGALATFSVFERELSAPPHGCGITAHNAAAPA